MEGEQEKHMAKHRAGIFSYEQGLLVRNPKIGAVRKRAVRRSVEEQKSRGEDKG